MTAVAYTHPDYQQNLPLWVKVEDVCQGQHQVKSKKEKYLTRRNPQDTSEEATQQYQTYLKNAVFYGVTGKTLGSLVGASFSQLPNFQRPDELEYLERNANGQGVSVYQLAQSALRLVLKNYRCGLYVDYPSVAPSRTRADDKGKNAYAMMHVIPAINIINWDTTVVGNQVKLSLVVIKEVVSVRGNDEFSRSTTTQYRVLRLEMSEQGNHVFTIQVYSDDGSGVLTAQGKQIPTDYQGNTWEYIPFTFIGAVDNTATIDNPPLLELADLNLAHYQDSADFQESVYFVGQPQFSMPDVDETMYELIKKDGLYIGCKNAFPTKIEMVQAQPNTLSQTAMDKKWEQMKELGARLIEQGSANKTATQANNDDAVQHSVLSLCVVNINNAFTQALRWVARFAVPSPDLIKPEDLIFSIPQEFSKPKFESERAKQLWEACLSGRYPYKGWYEYQRTGVMPDYSWDEVQKLIEEEKANEPIG